MTSFWIFDLALAAAWSVEIAKELEDWEHTADLVSPEGPLRSRYQRKRVFGSTGN